jgi:MFS family permease
VLRRYYAFQFFFSLLFWIPVFYEIERRCGLSDPQIFEINSLYQLAFCLLEIPTGLFADFWGRRRCLILGSALLVAANVAPLLSASYWGFLASFVVLAGARSLISGAGSAYLYDYLRSRSALDLYKGAEGKARAIYLVGRILGWSAIGPLMLWHLRIPYGLTAISGAVALAIALKLPRSESDLVRKRLRLARLWEDLEIPAVLRLVVRSPQLLFVIGQGIALFALVRISLDIFQPVLKLKGLPAAWFGVAFAAVSVFEALGAWRPGWIRRYLTDLQAVFVLTAVMAAALGAIPFFGAIGSLVAFAIYSFAVGISFPVQRQLINDAIPESRFRATVLSLESIVDRGVYAGVTLQIGVYLGRGEADTFLFGMAGAALLVIGALALALRLVQRPSLAA